MKKKLCSMALTILVMISSMAFCLPAVSAVEIGAGGWIWIEAEEYTDKSDNYTLYNSPESSNAQNMLLVLSPDVKNEYLEYSFNIETDGEYVIWALSSPGNSLWASPWKYSVNGGAEGDMSTVSQTGETVYVSTEGHGQAIGWYRLNMVNLTSGTNTLKFISNQGGAGNGLQYHLLDAIAIVPSTFN